jgi:mannose/fructose/N-acetylgalactosamine-specific phosphotransferase system component IIC
MPGLVQAGVDVGGLLQLTALTGLFVGGAVWDDAVVESVLAGMTGLRQLEMCDAPDFTDQGLLALAALTNLTQLRVLHCGLSTALCGLNSVATHEAEEQGYLALSAQVGDQRC